MIVKVGCTRWTSSGGCGVRGIEVCTSTRRVSCRNYPSQMSIADTIDGAWRDLVLVEPRWLRRIVFRKL
jgi:hypothetical protein